MKVPTDLKKAVVTAGLLGASDAELLSEVQRRRSAMRKTFGAGTGRPKVMKTCPGCGGEYGAREMKQHQCTGGTK